MLKELQNINERLIKIYGDSDTELKKQLLIKEILSKPNCFFDLDIKTAYSILSDLRIPKDKIKSVYLELIDAKNYSSK